MMLPKPNMRFVTVTAALFMLPYAALSYHFLSQAGRSRDGEVLRLLSVRAQISARIAQEALASSYQLDAIVSSPKFRSASWEERGRQLSAAQKLSPETYIQIMLADATGKVRAAAGTFDTRRDFSKDSLFIRTMMGQSLGRISRFEDMPPMLVASEPLYCKDGDRQPCGAVMSVVSLARLYDLIHLSRAGYEQGETMVSDSDGLIIADSKGLSAEQPGLALPPQIMALVRTRVPYRQVKVAGRGVFYVARAQVEGTSWQAIELEPASRPASSSSGDVKAKVAAGALLVVLFAFLLERIGAMLLIPRH